MRRPGITVVQVLLLSSIASGFAGGSISVWDQPPDPGLNADANWSKIRTSFDGISWGVAAVPSYALNWARHQATKEEFSRAGGSFGEALQQSSVHFGENTHWADWASSTLGDPNEASVFWEEQIAMAYALESNPCAPNRLCLDYVQVGYVFNSMTL